MLEPGLARCRNSYVSENDAFSFCLVSQSSRKTAQCCLEKNCVRAIERRTTVNSLPEGSHANHEKLYESEKRTILFRFFRSITFHRNAFDQPVEGINTISYKMSPDI